MTDVVQRGVLIWTNGFAPGTYSTNGFDGRLVNGDTALYWDNLDNGSQFSQSAIWVEQFSAETPYDAWTLEYGLSGSDAKLSANPDMDGLVNLTEYGLGGNPTNAMDVGILPVFAMVDAGGTTWFEYVYRRRSDAAARGLLYYLELNANLVSGVWTNTGYIVTGTGAMDAGFEVVTNRVPMEAFPTLFTRLRIKVE